MSDERCPVEQMVTRIFHGDAPRCECCGDRDNKCRWRPAYQMMLCPRCPGRFQKPTLTERKDDERDAT
jgi:hypothetical protein